MSQSDYLNFKKTSLLLKNSNKLPSILTPQYYTAFTSYNLETTVQNTKNSYSRLLASGKRYFFNIEKNVATCPTFTLCTNTNNRPNRVKNTTSIPRPIYKWKKTPAYAPKTCTFTNGYFTRKCYSTKKLSKYRLDYCGSTKKGDISGRSNSNNLGM